MAVVTKTLPDVATQDFATWYDANDSTAEVHDNVAGVFAPHEQSTPDMTVRLDAGRVLASGDVTQIAAQSTGTITAPVTNPRIDRVVVDSATGAVSVITGSEGASPSAPTIPSGKEPVASVYLTTSHTVIANSDITDERVFGTGGLGTAAVEDIGTSGANVPLLNGNNVHSGTNEFSGTVTNSDMAKFALRMATTVNNVTGDGTGYAIVYDTEVFDVGANCSAGVFTADRTGYCALEATVTLAGIGASHTAATISIVTSNRTYNFVINPYAIVNSGLSTITMSVFADMDAADTAVVNVNVSGGTKIVDIQGGTAVYNSFSGRQIP